MRRVENRKATALCPCHHSISRPTSVRRQPTLRMIFARYVSTVLVRQSSSERSRLRHPTYDVSADAPVL
jgi:hypothetical protein